jgi:hypothetical protein
LIKINFCFLVFLVPMLQRGNAYPVAPAASTGNYFKFFSVGTVQITGLRPVIMDKKLAAGATE